MPTPDCHLLLEVHDLSGLARPLVDAVLRIDLGARITPDATRGTVQVEGRFRKTEVIAAARRIGCEVLRVEERPPSPKVAGSTWFGWA